MKYLISNSKTSKIALSLIIMAVTPLLLAFYTMALEPVYIPIYTLKTPQSQPSESGVVPVTTVESRIRQIGAEIGLRQIDRAVAIAKCESGLRTTAVGDGGKSFGVWQIHLPAHPDITAQQACDL